MGSPLLDSTDRRVFNFFQPQSHILIFESFVLLGEFAIFLHQVLDLIPQLGDGTPQIILIIALCCDYAAIIFGYLAA